MEHKIVTCASYGGTGSSAITDLLKEFNNTKSMGSFEFALAHEVNGLSELQHFLVDDFHRLKTDEAIYRFKKLVNRVKKEYNPFFNNKFESIMEEYIKELIDLQWDGYWHEHMYRCTKLERFFKFILPLKFQSLNNKLFHKSRKYEFVPQQRKSPMYIAYGEDKFFEITKKYMEKLFNELDSQHKYKYLALDQLVPPTNTERYSQYFNNIKIIVVDRDPRDLYILNQVYWKEGWIPTENIDVYIKWFKILRKDVKKDCNSSNVLRVQFEDLIVNYEDTVSEIRSFLDLTEAEHIDKLKFFNPERSMKNFELWKKNDELPAEVKENILIIEKELSEFIYNR